MNREQRERRAILTLETVQRFVDAGRKQGQKDSPKVMAGKALQLTRHQVDEDLRWCVVNLGREIDWTRAEESEAPQIVVGDSGDLSAALRRALKNPLTLGDLASKLGVTRGQALDAIDMLRAQGGNVHLLGDRYALERTPGPVGHQEDRHVLRTDENGYIKLGCISDTHYGSKYARHDVAEALYDRFEEEGIQTVLHGGNWIDGEARFNKFELDVHGMGNQLRHFIEQYPRRPGITTKYIAGDDHEGWYAQKDAIDIGRLLEQEARDHGRTDLEYLGYVEAFLPVEHPSGARSMILLQHPGGGTAYATSYQAQKVIESLEGGEKPAVVCFGHWHKLFAFNVRNVWAIGIGCTKDQDAFGRKNKLDYHVGGVILELWLDENGAVVRCRPEMLRWFDRGYHNDKFNPGGPRRPVKA